MPAFFLSILLAVLLQVRLNKTDRKRETHREYLKARLQRRPLSSVARGYSEEHNMTFQLWDGNFCRHTCDPLADNERCLSFRRHLEAVGFSLYIRF